MYLSLSLSPPLLPLPARVQVTVGLTEEGERRWAEVGRVVFDHVRLLAGASDDALLAAWGEGQAMSATNFENDEPSQALGYANALCVRLLRCAIVSTSTTNRKNDPGVAVGSWPAHPCSAQSYTGFEVALALTLGESDGGEAPSSRATELFHIAAATGCLCLNTINMLK